tara:strand:- start:7 stop:420 length:414 start_codon:yes stop_codon:yes gene_type:complete
MKEVDMKIEVPISIGELFDKVSILQIKKEKILDKKMLNLVNDELSLLLEFVSIVIKNNKDREEKINNLIKNLKHINEELWRIEDKKRDCERKKIFDNNFIELARSVYIKNDKRAELKKEINLMFDSKIVEVKSYENY